MDHLSDLMADIFPDSAIATNFEMKHSKLQAVITNVLGVAEKESLVSDLKCHKFSVLVDERTDIVVDRLLEQWDALRLYFDSKWLDDCECREIHRRLNDPIIKAYYYFLSWMLPTFTNTNAYFQSENTVITEMHNKMRDLYRDLVTLVMKPECIRDDKLDKIDPTNENLYMNIQDIYLGLGVRKQFSLPEVANNVNAIQEFQTNCIKFITMALIGIRKRYSLHDQLLQAISTLNPEACVSHERPNSLAHFFTLLPRITPKSLDDEQQLDYQWRSLASFSQVKLGLNNPSGVF
ncbi:hypothetical protein EVAR_58884_1 [Eumeta japonica]|uniref:Uncharacterized protein n=1 Tax=Eumeta variegata TaxID=151549 RepID=A0A4C1Z764_EUMVA|nr:hypothetical protein EVAR_58884_1 [Eumeta japonica]